ATTGIEHVEYILSKGNPKKDIDHLIKTFTQGIKPIFGINISSKLLEAITEYLQDIPSLPIFTRLILMIASSMKISNLDLINELNISFCLLSKLLQIYGSSIYEGMHTYTTEDYVNNRKLFFNYLDVIEKIHIKQSEWALSCDNPYFYTHTNAQI